MESGDADIRALLDSVEQESPDAALLVDLLRMNQAERVARFFQES